MGFPDDVLGVSGRGRWCLATRSRFVLRVDGVWCVASCLRLRLCLGKGGAPPEGETPRVADVGAGRVATVAAVLCARVARRWVVSSTPNARTSFCSNERP